MKENTARALRTSSGKERRDEKTYRIHVSTGIFEHCPDMLDSVWLFLWYIDRTTEESNGEGRVLGGVPIVDSRPASELRMPVKTIRRWRLHLEEKEYIRIRRTPYGHVITLLKSKKWNWGPTLVQPEKTGARDLPNGEIYTKEIPHSGQSDLPNRAVRVPGSGSQSSPNGKYKEDKAVDSTEQDRDGAVEEATAAASLLLKRREEQEWKDINLAPCGSEQFQRAWEKIYEDSFTDERASDVMERCIMACQKAGISVPKPFFEAKRGVENGGVPSRVRYPLVDPLPERPEEKTAEPSRPAVQINSSLERSKNPLKHVAANY